MKHKKLKQNIIGLHNKIVRRKLESEKKEYGKTIINQLTENKQNEKINEEVKP